MKLTLFFIILTIDFDSIKQLIDLTRDDPTVYAIITALPDVIALLIYADIMSAIKNNFEHVAKQLIFCIVKAHRFCLLKHSFEKL